MKNSSVIAFLLACLTASAAFAGIATNITLKVGETTSVITRTYPNKWGSSQSLWWKLADGSSSVVQPAFVDPNTSDACKSRTHGTEAKFTFKGLKAGGPTTWKLYSRSSSYGYWSDGCGHTFTITVVAGGSPDTPTPTDANLFSVTPYVQHPATNAMTILFFTTAECRAKVMCWRTDGRGETNVAWTACEDVSTVLGKNPADSSDTTRFTKQYRHRVRFENLRTHTDYAYVVMPEGGRSYANVFRTLPGRDTPVRFIGICDTETTPGTGTTEWSLKNNSSVKNYYVSRSVGFASNIVHMVARKPDLITISGDLVAKGGYQKNWDEFWRENGGGLGLGYNDPAGSIPILASYGNHDLKERDTVQSDTGGEKPLAKYLTYFEYNPNGVDYANAPAAERDTRDLSQLFHREDLGPVTLIFLDTNKGDNGDCKKWTQDYAKRPAMRAPDFNPGSLQYAWLTNNLADAQRNSRFTFVINHHCPYSVGQHNRASNGSGYTSYNTGSGYDGESAQAVRILKDAMIRYGVDGWLCGHDEIQEHSQLSGTETLPDGTTRTHTLNVYDLGSGGDGLRGDKYVDNPYEVFRAYEKEPDTWSDGVLVSGGCHYGHLEVDVTTNKNGKWTCSLTPVYIFINKDKSGNVGGFERRCYKDRIIIDEASDRLVYQEWKGDTALPADHLEYERPPQASDDAGGDAPDPGPEPGAKPGARAFSVTPYVQHPATNAMTILFFTTNVCAATVRCWPTDGVVTQELAATCAAAGDLVGTGHSSDRPVWGTQYRHRVRFMDLQPGTEYRYEVCLDNAAGTYANCFRTAPDRDTPVRFVAYSDSETIPADFVESGTNNNKADTKGRVTEWEVRNKITSQTQTQTYPVSRSEGYASNIVHMAAWDPDLIVIAGDLVARGGVQLFWDEFWKENAGANGVGYNDLAGSTPILAALGNHDLYDNVGQPALSYGTGRNGEFGLTKYLTYFEFNPNGVDYANASVTEKDTRDLSQLFHREDYGPVTLVFIDSNNSELSGNDTNTGLTRNGSTGARSPSVLPGSLQYAWLTNNLADAQAKSRFTFVVCHHCPYSSGKHILAKDSQCALPLRALSDAMIRYGVDAWLCGHDEMQEHSQISGTEVRPDGSVRPHTVNVYDLGSAGDGLKGVAKATNTNAVFRAYEHATDGTHYGHLRVEVKKGVSGIWQCSLTPAYSYWTTDGSGLRNELRLYQDTIVITESGSTVYEQHKGTEPPVEEPLPPISPTTPTEEMVANEEFAQVLEKTPLEGKVTTLGEYSDFKKWVDQGVKVGKIAGQQAAKTNGMSFLSFATDQAAIIPETAVAEGSVRVEAMQVEKGNVKLTVSIRDLPVGVGAKQRYLERIFGVTGSASPDGAFGTEKVTYLNDMTRNDDGSVSYTAAPNVGEEKKPSAFFFRAKVTK